jgi:hypothetical protein
MNGALSSSRQARQSTTSLWKAGLVAATLAATANALIYGAGRIAGTIPQLVEVDALTGNGPMTATTFISTSVLAVLIATLFYAVLLRIARRPERVFLIAGSLLVIISLAMPFSIPDVAVKMAVTLALMHITTAIITLGGLVWMHPSRPD